MLLARSKDSSPSALLPDHMARPRARGILETRPAAPKPGVKARKKAPPLPDKFFLSDPKATAMINDKLTAVKQGGWAVKRGSDYFIYWYVGVQGKWTAPSGDAKPKQATIYAKDIGKTWMMHDPLAPAWARFVPDHFP